MNDETVAYLLDAEDITKLRVISARLYDSAVLSFDARRDFAYLVASICDRATEIDQPKLDRVYDVADSDLIAGALLSEALDGALKP